MQGKGGSNAVTKRPAGQGNSAATPTKSGGNRGGGVVSRRSATGNSGATNQGGIWRYYTDDAAGMKISPTAVLTVSFLFILMVVFLHLFAKFRR